MLLELNDLLLGMRFVALELLSTFIMKWNEERGPVACNCRVRLASEIGNRNHSADRGNQIKSC